MSSIIIVLPKLETAVKIKTILMRHGFAEAAACRTAAQALSEASERDCGIVISGYRLTDMYYTEIYENLPRYFDMLLLGSKSVISQSPSGILTLETPVKTADLVNTVSMMLSMLEKRMKPKGPRKRSWTEQNYINNAKMLLMERNHLTEEEAFRYIQKSSMDSGTNMTETAQMILMLALQEE